MKNRLLILCLFCLLWVSPVYAHDGSEHVTDLEMVVSGVGAIIFVLVLANTYLKQRAQQLQDDVD